MHINMCTAQFLYLIIVKSVSPFRPDLGRQKLKLRNGGMAGRMANASMEPVRLTVVFADIPNTLNLKAAVAYGAAFFLAALVSTVFLVTVGATREADRERILHMPLACRRFFIQVYLERDMTWQRPKRNCRLDQRGSRVSLLEKYHERHTLREIGRLRRNCGGRR